MANEFSEEEVVAFEQILEGFNDALVLSSAVSKYNMGDTTAERTNDTIWRPMPYIAQSFDGIDQTGNFYDSTQLSVPSTIGFKKSSPFTLTATDLRDGLQQNRLVSAAQQKLASDVNVALNNTAANQGTVVVKRTAAASGYDDVAECDSAFNEVGVPMDGRYLGLNSRDYNGMAGNLAARETMQGKPTAAYERSYVGNVAGFETLKMDYSPRLLAAGGTGVTINGAGQFYTPVATSTAATGETSNVDNRSQTVTIAVTGGTVAVGDCFTIAGVNSVHHITKEDTGQPKTFRILEIVSGGGGSGDVKISPPIISAEGATDAEGQYQNVTATPANGAAITFLNTATANVNPFWCKDAIELLPARYVLPPNSGLAHMTGTTDQGMTMTMTRQGDINDLSVKYRADVFFGTVMTQPEMAGIMLFSQP